MIGTSGELSNTDRSLLKTAIELNSNAVPFTSGNKSYLTTSARLDKTSFPFSYKPTVDTTGSNGSFTYDNFTEGNRSKLIFVNAFPSSKFLIIVRFGCYE